MGIEKKYINCIQHKNTVLKKTQQFCHCFKSKMNKS